MLRECRTENQPPFERDGDVIPSRRKTVRLAANGLAEHSRLDPSTSSKRKLGCKAAILRNLILWPKRMSMVRTSIQPTAECGRGSATDDKIIVIQKRDKRKSERRQRDRRQSPIPQRFRYGCWRAFHDATDIEKFAPLWRHSRVKIETALRREVARYRYFDRQLKVEIDGLLVLADAVQVVWNRLQSHEIIAIHTIEAIASEILDAFEVIPHDRRLGVNRRKLIPPFVGAVAVVDLTGCVE